jgi:hypothetical protein
MTKGLRDETILAARESETILVADQRNRRVLRSRMVQVILNLKFEVAHIFSVITPYWRPIT